MATVLTLRTALGTLLSSYLGTYTLSNGATTPAISVRDLGASLPAGQTVSGVECVIVSEPELDPIAQYREALSQSIWTVYLVDWSGATTKRLQEVAARIVWKYPNSQVFPITVPRGVGPRSQLRVNIRTDPDPIVS